MALLIAATVAGFFIFNPSNDDTAGSVESSLPTSTTEQVATSVTQTTAPEIPTSTAETVGASTSQPAEQPSLAVPSVPVDCVADGSPFVCITSIGVDANGNILADYDETGFVAVRGPAPNRHVHFFFPVASIAQDFNNAGVGGNDPATWIAWDDPTFGPGGSVRGYTIDQAVADGATELCVLVANADHSVIVDSGNCVPLPAEALG